LRSGLSLIFSRRGHRQSGGTAAFYALGAYISVEITKYSRFGPALVLSRSPSRCSHSHLSASYCEGFTTPIRISQPAGDVSGRWSPNRRSASSGVRRRCRLQSRRRFALRSSSRTSCSRAIGCDPRRRRRGPARRLAAAAPTFVRPRGPRRHPAADMVAALGIRLPAYMTRSSCSASAWQQLAGRSFAPITIVHPAIGRRDHHRRLCRRRHRRPRQLLGRGDRGALGCVVRASPSISRRAAGEASIYVLMFWCCWCAARAAWRAYQKFE